MTYKERLEREIAINAELRIKISLLEKELLIAEETILDLHLSLEANDDLINRLQRELDGSYP